jgi:hypothetical protein
MKSLLLTVFSLLLSLLMGEAMLRVAGYASTDFAARSANGWAVPDAEFGWTNRPGIVASKEAGNVQMTFWPNGQRASRSDLHRSGPRIDFVGDSITQGYGVADAETLVWQLGEKLPELAFENLGVGGYGTYQSLLRMQARAGDPPRVFVYGLFGDHRERNVASLSWVRSLFDAQGRNLIPPHALFEDGRLVEFLGGPIAPWPFEANSVIVTELKRAWLRYELRGRRDFVRPVMEALFAEMAKTAAEAKATLVVLLLADASDWMVPALQRNGIIVADCRNPEFERDPALRIGGVGHPTAARHAMWAECVAPFVARAAAP